MAIFHLTMRMFTRSKNHSAVKASAVRAGVDLFRDETNHTFKYSKREKLVEHEKILLPKNAPSKYMDREVLWNDAERHDTRKNSRVAREIQVALPHEISVEDMIKLCERYAQFLVDTYKVAVDLTVRKPSDEDDLNFHASFLMTVREVTETGMTIKTRVLDHYGTSKIEINRLRETWAKYTNEALFAAGSDERIDHRSNKTRGLSAAPQKKHYGRPEEVQAS